MCYAIKISTAEIERFCKIGDFEFTSEARRFENAGTANYPGAVGLAASLNLIHDLGQEKIAAHIHALTDQLIAGLDALQLEVITPRASARPMRLPKLPFWTFTIRIAREQRRLPAKSARGPPFWTARNLKPL